MLHAKRHGAHVDRKHLVERIRRYIADWFKTSSGGAGVIESNVQTSELVNGSLNLLPDFILSAHVGFDEEAFASGLFNHSHGFFSVLLTPPGYDDACAFGCERQGCGPPHAGGSAGDKDDFFVKTLHKK